jgi:YVTN family beta-propeller protein
MSRQFATICEPTITTNPAPTTPASVPPTLTPPSLPASTRLNFVINQVGPPSACPTSDDTVSAVASASAARHPPYHPAPYRPIAAHNAATPRFATTCEARLPLRASATPRASFLRLPNRVATKVSTNNAIKADNAGLVKTPKPIGTLTTSAEIRHTSSPTPAAGSVADLSIQTNPANPALNTTGNRSERTEPAATAERPPHTALSTSRGPTTATNHMDCARSRARGIAFVQCASLADPCISSPIPTSCLSLIYNRTLSIANTSTNAGAVLHLASIEAKGSTQSRSHRRPVRSAVQALRSTLSFAAVVAVLASVSGCGNNYRPVVSAINPVGPAAQPQKFAVAISSTGTATNPQPGLLTFVDFSGDTILITANVGVDPYYLILNGGTTTNSNANTGFTLNSDHTFTSFDIDTQLLTSQILQTTLLPGANPVAILPEGVNTYVTDPTVNLGQGNISQFTGSPLALRQQLAIDPGFTPVYTVGVANAPRVYALSSSLTPGAPGEASTIEVASNTLDPTPLKVGVNPVYGVMTADAKRAFVLNQGDGTVSVINAQTNALDTVPVGATNPITVGASPLWADFAPVRNEMVVANAGDGINPGSLSIISIPLCSATAQAGNPNCDLNNPVDAIGFGTVVATVPVGVNPVMVGVLQDTTNSRAYVINKGNTSLPCAAPTVAVTAATTTCSVSVINLNTNTVIATIPLPLSLSPNASTPANNGHPNYLAVTSGTPTGKVYVVSPDSNFMTIIRTDTDVVDTTVPLQGGGVSVRVTQP